MRQVVIHGLRLETGIMMLDCKMGAVGASGWVAAGLEVVSWVVAVQLGRLVSNRFACIDGWISSLPWTVAWLAITDRLAKVKGRLMQRSSGARK